MTVLLCKKCGALWTYYGSDEKPEICASCRLLERFKHEKKEKVLVLH